MFYVEKIEINNFAGIRQKEYSFVDKKGKPAQIVAFIGPNGSGKTSVMQALETAMFEMLARKNIAINNRHVIEDYKVNSHAGHSASITIAVRARCDAEAKNYRWTVSSRNSGSTMDLGSFEAKSLAQQLFPHKLTGRLPLVMSYPQNRFISGYKVMWEDTDDLITMNMLTVSRIESFEDIYDFPDAMQWVIDSTTIMSELGSSERISLAKLAASTPILKLPLGKKSKEMVSVKFITDMMMVVRKIIPSFDGILVDPMSKQLTVFKKGMPRFFRCLGFSEQMVIMLIADLIYRDLFTTIVDRRQAKELNGAVVIDSVDHKLEPAVLRKLLEVLKEHFPHRQFFLSAKSAEAFKNLKDIMLYSL